MSNLYNPNDFVYFVLLEQHINRASNSFLILYNDLETGETVEEKNHAGTPMRYVFNRAHRMLRVPARKEELIDKIRNHPQCKGSKNGVYRTLQNGEKLQVNALFSELNEEKDAELHLNAVEIQSKAMNLAMEVIKDEVKAEDLAAVLGVQDTGKKSHSKIVMYAQNNPQDFIDQVNAPDFKARALAKKAIASNALQRVGVMYKAGDFEYGLDIDEVVATLIRDEDKRRFLARQFKED